MTDSLLAQSVALSTGVLLLTTVLQLWRRSFTGAIGLLAVQGAALAGLVATLGLAQAEPELGVVAVLVLAIKAGVIPLVLARTAAVTGVPREAPPRLNPTAGLLLAALLTTVAYLASRSIIGETSSPTTRAVPVGLAMVLIGFLILLTRRQAMSQLIGFVVLDNGIAAVAFLTTGGVPLIVELGVSLDVLLVVLILRVLAGRMLRAFGATDLDDLMELRD
ncbi:MAG TPA: hypothetical protein VHM65_06385 [Candidatus Lustribacter sp.]|nr:hypothetical protein [Candidatus Lustribacter sp.]